MHVNELDMISNFQRHESENRFTIVNNNVGQLNEIPSLADNTGSRSTYMSTNLTQNTKWNVNSQKDQNHRDDFENSSVITITNKDDQDILNPLIEEEKTLTEVTSKKSEYNVNISQSFMNLELLVNC